MKPGKRERQDAAVDTDAPIDDQVYGVDDDGNIMLLGDSSKPSGETATLVDTKQQPLKAPRLAEERVAALPVGANLVETDGKYCTHEVAWPPDAPVGSLLPPPRRTDVPPAREYPFKIDPFQQTAINCLEAGKDAT